MSPCAAAAAGRFARPAVAAPPSPAAPRPPAAAAGGIQLDRAGRWTAGAGERDARRHLRRARGEGRRAGECAVFFFGPGQGGGVDDNVARWAKQFEGAPKADADDRHRRRPARHARRGRGHLPRPRRPDDAVDRQEDRATASSARSSRPPEGNVFFKLTGPAATVAAAQADFDALVASIRKK